jgi:uncharacterized protein
LIGGYFRIMIPTIKECFEFIEEYEMLENIRAHSIVVEKVANLIARGLINAGADLMIEKITAGALLHDIAKSICLETGGDHAVKGEEICIQNRLDEIADIVREHITLQRYKPDAAICEKEIIYYADKRVNHDSVVSLEERLAYLLKRYGRDDNVLCGLIRDNFDLCKNVEYKLFKGLAFRPELVGRMVNPSP